MIAFVTFIKTFGIWIYLLCGLGILFGIKMLYDARSLSRTTLFSMDQERAVEQTQRGLLLIAIMAVIVFAVTVVNVVIAPFVPQAEPPIVRGVTPTVANIFPTSAPTLTASPTVVKPTETIFMTGTPAPPPGAISSTPPPVPVSTVIRPTQAITSVSNLLPSPVLVYDKSKGDAVFNGVSVNNENAMNNSLIFKWSWSCTQCVLGPNDKFIVVVTYTDKQSGLNKVIAGGTQNNQLTMGEIIRGYGDSGQFYQKAKDDMYMWYVQVKRAPGDQVVSAPSETWKFAWH